MFKQSDPSFALDGRKRSQIRIEFVRPHLAGHEQRHKPITHKLMDGRDMLRDYAHGQCVEHDSAETQKHMPLAGCEFSFAQISQELEQHFAPELPPPRTFIVATEKEQHIRQSIAIQYVGLAQDAAEDVHG